MGNGFLACAHIYKGLVEGKMQEKAIPTHELANIYHLTTYKACDSPLPLVKSPNVFHDMRNISSNSAFCVW